MSAIDRARALFVTEATRNERNALSTRELHAENLSDLDARKRAKASLPELRKTLARAEKAAGEKFDREAGSPEPSFTREELTELWNAIAQYIENHAEESDVSEAARTASNKLDAMMGATL